MNSNVTAYSTNIRSATHGGGSFIFSPLFKKCFLYQTAGLKGLSILRSCIRRVASGGAGGHCPPDFCFSPPIYFLPPTVFFCEEKVAVFGRKNRLNLRFRPEKAFGFRPEKAFGFRRRPFFFFLFGDHLFLAGKSLRISSKTFFFFFFRDHPIFAKNSP